MKVKRYESDLLCSSMYLIEEAGHAIVIDPCRNTNMLSGLRIDKIILTHEHYDHISGVNLWKQKTNAPVLCSKACAEHIQNPKKSMAAYFEVLCELQTWVKLDNIPQADGSYTCIADETFENEMDFYWYGHGFHLFELPGHSLGSIGILLDNKFFFSGDSLIENNKIELLLPGGNRKLWERIGAPRLESIPKGIMVYPGHFKEFVFKEF